MLRPRINTLNSRVDIECLLSFSTTVLLVGAAAKGYIARNDTNPDPGSWSIKLLFYSSLLLLATGLVQIYLPKLVSQLHNQLNQDESTSEKSSAVTWLPNPHVVPLPDITEDTGEEDSNRSHVDKSSLITLKIYALQIFLIFSCIGLLRSHYRSIDAAFPYRSLIEFLALCLSMSAVTVLAELRFLFFQRSFVNGRVKFFFNDFISFTGNLLQLWLAWLIFLPPEWLAGLCFKDPMNKARANAPALRWFKGICMVLSPLSGFYVLGGVLRLLLFS